MPASPSRQPPATILTQALTTCVQDGHFHEDMLLGAMATLAQDAGLPAQLIELKASNYPLPQRLGVEARPADYDFHVKVFLELDGHLFRVALTPSTRASREDRPREDIIVLEYDSRQEAMEALASPLSAPCSHHEWSVMDEPGDQSAIDALARVLSLPELKANLELAALERSTGPGSPGSHPPRL